MAKIKATVWDAYRKNQYTGTVVKEYENGSLTLDLSNGLRYFVTRDRVIQIDKEDN